MFGPAFRTRGARSRRLSFPLSVRLGNVRDCHCICTGELAMLELEVGLKRAAAVGRQRLSACPRRLQSRSYANGAIGVCTRRSRQNQSLHPRRQCLTQSFHGHRSDTPRTLLDSPRSSFDPLAVTARTSRGHRPILSGHHWGLSRTGPVGAQGWSQSGARGLAEPRGDK